MSNIFTLDSLREEVEKEFAPVKITVGEDEITLRNVLRLDKSKRDDVLAGLKSLDELREDDSKTDGSDIDLVTEAVSEILSTVADKGKTLVTAIGDDFHLLMKVFEVWMEGTQPGEASNSPDS